MVHPTSAYSLHTKLLKVINQFIMQNSAKVILKISDLEKMGSYPNFFIDGSQKCFKTQKDNDQSGTRTHATFVTRN
jgi:hypothetical protein